MTPLLPAPVRHALRAVRRAPAFSAWLLLTTTAGPALGTALLTFALAGSRWTPPREAPGFARDASLAAGGWTETLRGAAELRHEGLSGMMDVLTAAAALVLAAACVNAAALLLARAAARRHETAVRAALGAAPRRLVARALGEGALLVIPGAALGAALGVAGAAALRGAWPGEGAWLGSGPEPAAVAVAGGTLLAAALLFALLPVVRAGRGNLHAALTVGSRATPGRHEGWVRRAVTVGQMAASVTLLAGAGLLLRGAAPRAGAAEPGFDPRDTLTLRLEVPPALRADPARHAAALEEALGRLRALPGVRAASFATPDAWLGVGPEDYVMSLCPPCWAANVRLPMPVARSRHAAVSPGYFAALGVPLQEGRELTAADGAAGEPAVVVSRAFASRLFPHSTALGRQVVPNGLTGARFRVVGIVGDVRPTGPGTQPDAQPMLYFAALAHPPAEVGVAVRAARGDPLALAPAVERAVKAAVPGARVGDVTTMEARLAAYRAPLTWFAAVLAAVAAAAVLLCAGGVYGVVSYGVARRTREIGVRMALGARGRQVTAMVLGEGGRIAARGALLGLCGAVSLARSLQLAFRGIDAGDLETYAGAVLVLAGAALLASLVPARRAVRVDPMVALRAD